MPRRDPNVALRHMLDHAREAATPARGKGLDEAVADRILSLALVRLLEIIGEAANRVPLQERTRYPNVPWREIIGLRNRLIHGYDAVDYQILWQIITVDLPVLIPALEAIFTAQDRT